MGRRKGSNKTNSDHRLHTSRKQRPSRVHQERSRSESSSIDTKSFVFFFLLTQSCQLESPPPFAHLTSKFVVASEESQLRSWCRQREGQPLLFIETSRFALDKPSKITKAKAKQVTRRVLFTFCSYFQHRLMQKSCASQQILHLLLRLHHRLRLQCFTSSIVKQKDLILFQC